MKERLTITLDKDILLKVDEKIDKNVIKNRSHAIEVLLEKSLRIEKPKTAVILCGGKGTRLRPVTYEIPKALIPIQGKTITEHLFDLFKKYGITNIILAVGYMKDKIKNHFGDGSKFGVKITYVEESKPKGTAGPLRLAQKYLKNSFIVTNGDELKDINIDEMYKLHKNSKALATIALTTVEDPSKYGVAKLSGSKILEFVEKPKKDAPSRLINSGFYILEPEIIGLIPKDFAMLEKDVFPKIASMNRLYGYHFSGQWFDTGNIKSWEVAMQKWKGI